MLERVVAGVKTVVREVAVTVRVVVEVTNCVLVGRVATMVLVGVAAVVVDWVCRISKPLNPWSFDDEK